MKDPGAPSLEMLLDEYRKQFDRVADGKTINEWAEAWGLSPMKTRELCKIGIKNGSMTAVHAHRECITRPGYHVVVTLISFVKGGGSRAARRKADPARARRRA